jgi:hypothetical protein
MQKKIKRRRKDKYDKKARKRKEQREENSCFRNRKYSVLRAGFHV